MKKIFKRGFLAVLVMAIFSCEKIGFKDENAAPTNSIVSKTRCEYPATFYGYVFVQGDSEADTIQKCKQIRGEMLYNVLLYTQTSWVFHNKVIQFYDTSGALHVCKINAEGTPGIVFADLSDDFIQAYNEGRFRANVTYNDYTAFLDSVLPLECDP